MGTISNSIQGTVFTIDGKNEIAFGTEERAKYLFTTIKDNTKSGTDLYLDNCELICELRDTKGYLHLGYNSFKECAGELFEKGETQAKNMCLIANTYGSQNPDGSFTISDSNREVMRNYTPTALLYIRNFEDFNTADIKGFIESKGITEDTTATAIRELVKAEKDAKKAEKAGDNATEDLATEDVAEDVSTEDVAEDVETADMLATEENYISTLEDELISTVYAIRDIINGKGKATEKLDAISQTIAKYL